MPHPSTISPLAAFQKAFPSVNLIASDEELRYRFRSKSCLDLHNRMAQRLILDKGLKVTAETEVWETGGYVHELALVVKLVAR